MNLFEPCRTFRQYFNLKLIECHIVIATHGPLVNFILISWILMKYFLYEIHQTRHGQHFVLANFAHEQKYSQKFHFCLHGKGWVIFNTFLFLMPLMNLRPTSGQTLQHFFFSQNATHTFHRNKIVYFLNWNSIKLKCYWIALLKSFWTVGYCTITPRRMTKNKRKVQ